MGDNGKEGHHAVVQFAKLVGTGNLAELSSLEAPLQHGAGVSQKTDAPLVATRHEQGHAGVVGVGEMSANDRVDNVEGGHEFPVRLFDGNVHHGFGGLQTTLVVSQQAFQT